MPQSPLATAPRIVSTSNMVGKAGLERLVPVLLAALTSAGCFDDPYRSTGGNLETVDAGTPGQRRFGNLLYFETRYLEQPSEGDGAFIIIGPFQIKDEQLDPVYEEAEGSPFACKVYEKTAAQYKDPGVDIGTLNFSIAGGPVIPPCKLVDGEWACIGMEGSGGDIAVVDAGQGIMSLTDSAVTFGPEEIGRVVKFTGTTQPANEGTFPIVAVPDSHTIQFHNPRTTAAAEPATPATWRTEYGEGPARQTDPVKNDDFLTVSLAAGGEGNFDDFSKTLEFGDAFTLDTASQATIQNIPMDGSEFTVGCDGEGGDCSEADATALTLETTDAPLDPDFPTAFPDPVTKHVQIFCLLLIGRVTVPAEASQYLVDSGATRVRAIFGRALSEQEIQKYAEITVVAGHAVMGFTDP